MVFKKDRGFYKGLVVSEEARGFQRRTEPFKNEKGVPERTGGFRGGEKFKGLHAEKNISFQRG